MSVLVHTLGFVRHFIGQTDTHTERQTERPKYRKLLVAAKNLRCPRREKEWEPSEQWYI